MLGFIIGLFVGVFVGVCIMCLFTAIPKDCEDNNK